MAGADPAASSGTRVSPAPDARGTAGGGRLTTASALRSRSPDDLALGSLLAPTENSFVAVAPPPRLSATVSFAV